MYSLASKLEVMDEMLFDMGVVESALCKEISFVLDGHLRERLM